MTKCTRDVLGPAFLQIGGYSVSFRTGTAAARAPLKTDDPHQHGGTKTQQRSFQAAFLDLKMKHPATQLKSDDAAETRTRFLLLDKRVVDRNESSVGNVSLVNGRATKEAANPLICEDMPWELTWLNTDPDIWFDNGVWHAFYLSCLSCPLPITRPGACPTANYKFKYRPAATYNGNKINPHARVMGTLYGNSSDGIEWEKPILNLVGGVITLILCCCPCAAAYLDRSASLSI